MSKIKLIDDDDGDSSYYRKQSRLVVFPQNKGEMQGLCSTKAEACFRFFRLMYIVLDDPNLIHFSFAIFHA
jgi:hypothetical protein